MAGLQNTGELRYKHIDKVNTGDLNAELFPTRKDSAKYIFYTIPPFLFPHCCHVSVSRGQDKDQVVAAQILTALLNTAL